MIPSVVSHLSTRKGRPSTRKLRTFRVSRVTRGKQAARLLLVVEPQRKVFDVLVHLVPDIRHHAGAHPGRQPAVRHLAKPAQDQETGHDRNEPEKEGLVPVHEGVVNNELRDLGREEFRHAEHREQDHHDYRLGPVRPEIGTDPFQHAPLAHASRAQAIFHGQTPAAGFADHAGEFGLYLERLLLYVLFDAALGLVEPIDPALGVPDHREGVIGGGDFEAGAAHQGLHGDPGEVRQWDGDIVAGPVQLQGHDTAIGDDQPGRFEPAPGVHIGFQGDPYLLIRVQYGVEFTLDGIRQGIGQLHGTPFGTLPRGTPPGGVDETGQLATLRMHFESRIRRAADRGDCGPATVCEVTLFDLKVK